MANLSSTPGIVEVNLEAQIAPITINGVTANCQTVPASINPAAQCPAVPANAVTRQITLSMGMMGVWEIQ